MAPIRLAVRRGAKANGYCLAGRQQPIFAGQSCYSQ